MMPCGRTVVTELARQWREMADQAEVLQQQRLAEKRGDKSRLVIAFVAGSMISAVRRFEPKRMLARALITLIYLTSAFAILAKLR